MPTQVYTRFGVTATTGHTYVSLAQQGEEGNYIVFRVTALRVPSGWIPLTCAVQIVDREGN